MIVGTGVDLVSIRRIERVYRRHAMRFLRRVFSTTELALLMARPFPLPSIAARFAAKEAVLKAIGCGIGPASLREVEILAKRGQKPAVRLSGWAAPGWPGSAASTRWSCRWRTNRPSPVR